MKFIDLNQQQIQKTDSGITLREKINKNIKDVIDSGNFILGPAVDLLEKTLCDFVGVSNCIAVSSGTDALVIALMSLGIGPGDEVITTSFSFISSAEAIALLGAKPVFVDIDKETFNIDPAEVERAISKSTKAIIAVSLYGQPADFKSINKIAKENDIFVIEDGAQSFGSSQNNQKSCGLSYIGITSFFPSKPLGCYGDGGACFTNDSSLGDRMRILSRHGQTKRYYHQEIGINGRIDTIQAAILLAKFEIFEKEVKLRQKIAEIYNQKFYEGQFFEVPKIKKGNTSVFAQYTLRVPFREKIQHLLKEKNIPTAIHYPGILPEQKAFDNQRNYNNNQFPVAKKASKEVISIPMHPYLEEKEQEFIVKSFLDIFNSVI